MSYTLFKLGLFSGVPNVLSKHIPLLSKSKNQNEQFMTREESDYGIFGSMINSNDSNEEIDAKLNNHISARKIETNAENIHEILNKFHERNLTYRVRHFYLDYELLIQTVDNLVTLALVSFMYNGSRCTYF